MGAYEIAEKAPANVDLAVTAVHGPSAATGQVATVGGRWSTRGSTRPPAPGSIRSICPLRQRWMGAAAAGPGHTVGSWRREQAIRRLTGPPLLPDGNYPILVVSDMPARWQARIVRTTRPGTSDDYDRHPTLPMDTNVTGTIAAGRAVVARRPGPRHPDHRQLCGALPVEFYARYGALPKRDSRRPRPTRRRGNRRWRCFGQSAPVGIWLHGSATAGAARVIPSGPRRSASAC